MKDFFIKLVSDGDGHISSSRFLNVVVGIAAMLISWKLVLLGGYNETYFGLLLAYGGGTYSWGKYVENKHGVSTTSATRGTNPRPEGDSGRGGHAGSDGRDVLPAAGTEGTETPEEAAVRRRLASQQD